MGGGTTRVGDPSGKDETRKILSLEEIDANKAGMQQAFAKFLPSATGKTDAVMVDNAEWLARLNYIEFLRDVGRHFSVNRMLTMDSAKLRLEREQELSFIEFNYMLLQAYDFVELARRYGCNLQMGGSDQWGNIVTGIDLGRRMGIEHAALRAHLPAADDRVGRQDGQDGRGRRVAQRGAALALRLLAVLAQHRGRRRRALPEAVHDAAARRDRALAALQGAEINEAKKVLATEATALLHGREKAEAAAETARKTFEQGALAEDLPTVEIAKAGSRERHRRARPPSSRPGSSTRTARRAGRSRAAACGSTTSPSPTRRRSSRAADLVAGGVIKLSLGKKKHVLLKPV